MIGVPALELKSRAASSVGVKYRIHGPNTGSNLGGGQIIKNNNNIGEFLRDNLTEDRDKGSIRRIMAGNKLAYGEANDLIRSLM